MAPATQLRLSDSSDSTAKSTSTANSTSTTATELSVASWPEFRQLDTKPFTTIRRLYNEIRSSNHDCLTYNAVPEDIARQIEKWQERTGSGCRLFYLAERQVLIITLPTAPHEQLHLELNQQVMDQMRDAGLRKGWMNKGATRYQFGGSRGEGDSTGGPADQRGGGEDWPTLVIEAGMSQTWPSLIVKMRWWFRASAGQVKIVLLTKLEKANRQITIQKWILAEQRARVGATETRRFVEARYEPMLSHTVTFIIPTDTTNLAANMTVQGAPLILEFGLLFLRPPNANEIDVCLNEQDLRLWAERVWNSLPVDQQ